MAKQEQDQLLIAYPNLGPYIRAARKRGYTDEEIDGAIAQGISARREAGRSIEEINQEFGITQPESTWERVRRVWGGKAPTVVFDPESQREQLTGLAEQDAPLLQLETVEQATARQERERLFETAKNLGRTLYGGEFAEEQLFKPAAMHAEWAARSPRELTGVFGETAPAIAEAGLRGILPGTETRGFPGTEAENALFTEAYPGMSQLLRDIGPSKFELGLPIPAAAVPAVERAAAMTLSRLGRAALPAAIAAELATFSPADITGQLPIRGARGTTPIIPPFEPPTPPLAPAPFLDPTTQFQPPQLAPAAFLQQTPRVPTPTTPSAAGTANQLPPFAQQIPQAPTRFQAPELAPAPFLQPRLGPSGTVGFGAPPSQAARANQPLSHSFDNVPEPLLDDGNQFVMDFPDISTRVSEPTATERALADLFGEPHPTFSRTPQENELAGLQAFNERLNRQIAESRAAFERRSSVQPFDLSQTVDPRTGAVVPRQPELPFAQPASALPPSFSGGVPFAESLGPLDPGAAQHFARSQAAGRFEGMSPEQASVAFSARRAQAPGVPRPREMGKKAPARPAQPQEAKVLVRLADGTEAEGVVMGNAPFGGNVLVRLDIGQQVSVKPSQIIGTPKSLGGGGTGAFESPNVLGPFEDVRFQQLEGPLLPDEIRGVRAEPGPRFHAAGFAKGQDALVPPSQSLAVIPGRGPVDTTRLGPFPVDEGQLITVPDPDLGPGRSQVFETDPLGGLREPISGPSRFARTPVDEEGATFIRGLESSGPGKSKEFFGSAGKFSAEAAKLRQRLPPEIPGLSLPDELARPQGQRVEVPAAFGRDTGVLESRAVENPLVDFGGEGKVSAPARSALRISPGYVDPSTGQEFPSRMMFEPTGAPLTERAVQAPEDLIPIEKGGRGPRPPVPRVAGEPPAFPPRNRFGEELDPRKMAQRERFAQRTLSQASDGFPRTPTVDPANRAEANRLLTEIEDLEREFPLSGSNIKLANEIEGEISTLRKRLDELSLSRPALDDLTRRFDDLSSKFSAMPGAAGIDEAIEAAVKVSKELLGKLKSTPAQQATKRLIASFQRKKGRTLNKAREEVKTWTREIHKALKEGKLTPKEAEEGAKAVEEVVKNTVAAQNRVHRAVLIHAARKQFPGATRRDILAAAGEIDALSDGLQLSGWQRAADWIGSKTRTGVGLFKTVKVLGSTTAYANNVGSNLISGYFAGLSPRDVPLLMSAIADLRVNGPLTKQAIDAGLFGTEFFSKDLDTLLRELELAGKGKKNAAEMLESFWRKNTGKAAAVYDGIDKVFKLATYQKAVNNGILTGRNPFGGVTKLSPREAVEHVNLYFPNYERLGPAAQRFRKATTTALAIHPFLAFPLEYARIYKNAAIHKPFHMAAAVSAIGGAALYGELGTGVERPEYHSLPSKLSVPIPFTRDSRGKPRFVDLTYVVPLADTFSSFRRDPGKSWAQQTIGSFRDPSSGLLTSAIANIATRGIISPQDEKFRKPGEPGLIGSAVSLATNPSLETGQQLLRAQPVPFGQKLGTLGRERAHGEDPSAFREAGEFIGFRMLPDSSIERKRARGEFTGKERQLQMDISQVKNDKSLTRDERLQRVNKLQEELHNLRRSRR